MTSMNEHVEHVGAVATRLLFENDDLKVWEMDPGNKSETFLNNGPGPYREVLVELKRLPRADQRALSFTKCEALVGQKPAPGITRILENDRLVISETMLPPDQEAIVASARDAITYVLEGGHLALSEPTEGKRARLLEEDRPPHGVYWEAAGSSRKLKNLGRANYRHLTVELK
jgi:hypothetical protein